MTSKILHLTGYAAALAALTVFLVGCTPAPAPAPDTRAADEKAIREADAAWLNAITTKELEKTLSFWADDGVTMEPGRPIIVGKDAVRKMWQEFLAMPDVSLTWTTTQIVVAKAGDIAYQHGTYEFSMKDSKGKPIQEKGKYLTVWRKQADGAWKVSIDIHNSDGPPPKTDKK
jgi:uncharacterized protein (TIGR02246 family)